MPVLWPHGEERTGYQADLGYSGQVILRGLPLWPCLRFQPCEEGRGGWREPVSLPVQAASVQESLAE